MSLWVAGRLWHFSACRGSPPVFAFIFNGVLPACDSVFKSPLVYEDTGRVGSVPSLLWHNLILTNIPAVNTISKSDQHSEVLGVWKSTYKFGVGDTV